jgi:ferrochelatase
MSRFTGQNKDLHKQKASTGVLLTNLGSPEQADAASVRRFLRQFLSDPRVVEIPRLVWLIILHGIILRVRPAKSAKLYAKIWTDKGSPLTVITGAQTEKMAEQLKKQYGDDVIVTSAMRYGKPSIAQRLQEFQASGVRNIVVLPLYPQYAAPTTGSTFDAVASELKRWRWVPSLHFISSYHDHPLYIQALASSIQTHIEKHGKPDKLILSYHGMPQLFLERGDPYYCFCHKTTRLLKEKLGWSEDDYTMTFQSRFGKAQWLKPYTEQTLAELAQQGLKHIAIISPAFSADCLETLEELEHENREVFIQAGGEQYHYIAALNDQDEHISALLDLVTPSITRFD